MRSCTRSFVALLGLATFCLTAPLDAQSCGVRNGFRIVSSHAVGGISELAVDSGWQTTAPLSTPGANSNPSATCFSQGTCTPTSDYGHLRCTGSGSASNCAQGGTFLMLDQTPQARFFDTVTVASSTLPWGTPVQLRAGLTLHGFATMNDSVPSVFFEARWNTPYVALAVTNGPGTQTGVFTTTVGASFTVHGNLNVALSAGGITNFGFPPSTASYAVDLTARMDLAPVTPGVSLSWCSGRTYAPLSAAVTDVGGGCGAGSPVLTAALPILGATQNYGLTSSIANQPVFLAASFGGATTNAFGPCTVRVDLGSAVSYLVGATDAGGACAFGLAVPAMPALVGVVLTTQAVVFSPGGPLLGAAQLSNALEVAFGV